MGSAAVFFDLLNSGRLARRAITLADVNPDLIGCYRTLRDRPEAVIRALNALAREHRAGGNDYYYEVRDTRFNPLRAALQARAAEPGDVADMYTPGLAAMLIFLNRTGFNGLFRLNRQGGFNVPAGRYTNPRICDETHLRGVAAALARPGVTIASPIVRPHTGRGRHRRLRVLRSAVCATEPDVELRELHGRRLHHVRSAASAAEGRRGVQARRVRRGLEFERGRNPERLHDDRSPEGRSRSAPGAGAPGNQLEGVISRAG